ncbi:MAG: helix-turn-helix transcriptional regulator [Planctomycetes bacterium]|nr:helix-turn-helix transcriptional regulator [Planctomycetota bacterium]
MSTATTPGRPQASSPAADPLVERVCAYLRDRADEPVRLADLAPVAGLSSGYLQRRFSAAMGCSPKAWLRECCAGYRWGIERKRRLLERERGASR